MAISVFKTVHAPPPHWKLTFLEAFIYSSFRPPGASCSTKANRYVDDLVKTSLNRFTQLENDQIEQMFEPDAKKAPFAESLRPFHAILEAVSFADDKKREKVGWTKKGWNDDLWL